LLDRAGGGLQPVDKVRVGMAERRTGLGCGKRRRHASVGKMDRHRHAAQVLGDLAPVEGEALLAGRGQFGRQLRGIGDGLRGQGHEVGHVLDGRVRADRPAVRARIGSALVLVVMLKLVQLSIAWLYGRAVDRMVPGMESTAPIAIALVAAYAAARFGGVLFDNLRNVVFERVGQDATRRLAENVFVHLHSLSLRFHPNRRPGAVTKVIERGTKSIDLMLLLLSFNIAPCPPKSRKRSRPNHFGFFGLNRKNFVHKT